MFYSLLMRIAYIISLRTEYIHMWIGNSRIPCTFTSCKMLNARGNEKKIIKLHGQTKVFLICTNFRLTNFLIVLWLFSFVSSVCLSFFLLLIIFEIIYGHQKGPPKNWLKFVKILGLDGHRPNATSMRFSNIQNSNYFHTRNLLQILPLT